MDYKDFETYLKKGGRSPNAIKRCVKYVTEFQEYLEIYGNGKKLADVEDRDLINFVEWIERESDSSAKGYLWAVRYYYDYVSNEEITSLASQMREMRIERGPSPLKVFRGVNPDHVDRLAELGIKNINQMLKAGLTERDRDELSKKTGLPCSDILEFVKLSDLARIPGVKGIRARLYYDAGIDTVEKMASWQPDKLVEKIKEFVIETNFDGIPTLPAEAKFTIDKAKNLPKIVQY